MIFFIIIWVEEVNNPVTSNADCLPGYIRNGDICEPCPEGETSVDHITCVPCLAGQYYNRTKINRCQPCPVGSTTTEPGTIDITNCSMFFNCKICALTQDYGRCKHFKE